MPEGTRIYYQCISDPVDTAGFMNMSRQAQQGPGSLDTPPDRPAAHMAKTHGFIQPGFIGRLMAYHDAPFEAFFFKGFQTLFELLLRQLPGCRRRPARGPARTAIRRPAVPYP